MRTTVIRFLAAAVLLAGTRSVFADVHYVDVNSTNATPPYTNWATAATNIQDAVDVAVAGDEVVVTNGFYQPVAVDKPLSLGSVNGPQVTSIFGGNSCVYLTNGATLSGFTLTHGGQIGFIGGVNGRGVQCDRRSSAVVNNCVITGNYAFASRDAYGGGAYGGTLNNCTLTDNYVQDVSASAYGGGAYLCTLNNCVLSGNNSAGDPFGGPVVAASGHGGGAAGCTLNNCTLTGNSVSSTLSSSEDIFGGGAYQCTLKNCILSDNRVSDRWFGQSESDYSQSTLIYCLSGDWSFAEYVFVDYVGGNLRLQPGSPCINAGNNSYATNATDLDGNPRISGGTVDIGAYEYQCPQLTLIPDAAYVLLLWPTNNLGYDYTGFTVQSTTNLGSPVWSTNSPAPVVIGGQNVIINPMSGPQQFYRLVQ